MRMDAMGWSEDRTILLRLVRNELQRREMMFLQCRQLLSEVRRTWEGMIEEAITIRHWKIQPARGAGSKLRAENSCPTAEHRCGVSEMANHGGGTALCNVQLEP